MRVQRCKGTRDLCPEEMARFRFVEGVFRECCLKWGYEEVKTPTLEYLHLFTSTGTLTPTLLSKVYSFLDWDGWSGERVVLRPDATIPVARLYIENLRDKGLARLFYITNIFRFEETGKETRDRWQGGAELIGVSSPVADVELITMAREILGKLGLKDAELRLTHAGLIRSLLQELGLSPQEQAKAFDQILDGDAGALAKIKSERPELGRAMVSLLDLQGKSSGFLKNLRALLSFDLPDLAPHIEDFISIVDLLKAMGVKYQIDIACGRGFEYYTGLIFQFFVGEEKIGGGGRYDALIPLMGGGDVPASGFGLYFDYLMKSAPAAFAKGKTAKVLVRAAGDNLKEALSAVSRLHEAGYVAELDLTDRKRQGFRWTLDVQSQKPVYILRDAVKKTRFEAQNMEEVLRLMGEGNVTKDSTA